MELPPVGATCLQTGQLLSERYRVAQLLGTSAAFETYLVRDTLRHNRKLVAKCLIPSLASDPVMCVDFEREARVLGRIKHRLVPTLHSLVIIDSPTGPLPCMLTGYFNKPSLHDLLRKGTPLSRRRVLQMGVQLAGLLQYLHAQQPSIVHRGICPENIVMGERGPVHLVDFGAVKFWLAKPSDHDRVDPEMKAFLAPEYLRGRPCPQSDFFSLGATMIHALTARFPSKPLDWRSLVPSLQVGDGLRSALQDMVTPSPKRRPRDAARLHRDLLGCARLRYMD